MIPFLESNLDYFRNCSIRYFNILIDLPKKNNINASAKITTDFCITNFEICNIMYEK